MQNIYKIFNQTFTTCFAGKRNRKLPDVDDQSASSSSTLSTAAIKSVIENLKLQKFRNSTKMNYYGIWKNFNQFFLKLDVKPDNWEDRLTLYRLPY